MEDRCEECERTAEELSDLGIDMQLDKKYCDECHSKLMQEWEKEQEELNRYWRSTRI